MKRDLLSRLYDVRSTGGEWAPGLIASAELVNPDGPAAAREIERLRKALEKIAKEQSGATASEVADRFQQIARAALQPSE